MINTIIWKINTTYNIAKKVQENIIQNTTSGSIIVMHNNQMSFKNLEPILEKTIQQLKAKGYNFSATW